MKMKMLLIVCSFLSIMSCSSNGCMAWENCANSRCGGCDVGYWSTSCPVSSTGGASEAAFTDIGNVCDGDACSHNYYSECTSNSCNSGMNW